MEAKPGYKTSEFYLTIVAQVLSLLVILGSLTSSQASDLNVAITNTVQGIAALVASAITAWKYISSRTEIKSLETEKE